MNRFLLCTLLLATSAAAFASPQASENRRDIDKVNGGITAEAGQAYGDLGTVNGGIELARGASAEEVETVNGGISAEDAVTAREVSTVNGAIRFGRDGRINGNLETVNGGIFIDRGSRVGGDVSTVNGAIGLVGTAVEGRIETVNGDVTVGADSRVARGIRIEKPKGNFGLNFGKHKIPRVVIGPNAVVDGPLVFEREVKLYVHASARIGSVSGATAVRYDGATPPKD
ncbi:hypothetical protein [Thermomonas sp.]|jgi:hypothetical protein|uniref:hypothetical protein n=1 Tax=Thermomonas sp. TaxID=1971895 RepID=UPI00257CEFC4|nr:hypothetical protein [Thermomonas sp.]